MYKETNVYPCQYKKFLLCMLHSTIKVQLFLQSIRLSCYSLDKYCVLILFLQVLRLILLDWDLQKSFMFQKSRI